MPNELIKKLIFAVGMFQEMIFALRGLKFAVRASDQQLILAVGSVQKLILAVGSIQELKLAVGSVQELILAIGSVQKLIFAVH